MSDAFTFQIKQMLEKTNFIEKQFGELENKIFDLLAKTNSVITTILGMGNVVSAVIIGEIGSLSRFDSASKLVVYASLDVRVSQSRQFICTQMKISKKGSY